VPQHMIKTTVEAGAGSVNAVVAAGALSTSPCDPPTVSDYPLWLMGQYIVTFDDVVRLIACVGTVITIVYFAGKLRKDG